MTQINGLTAMITAMGGTEPGTWTATVDIDSSTFDPYMSDGLAVGSDAYASLATYYQGDYANDGSYGCVVENVSIQSFVVGVAIGLSGAVALSADITFRNVNVSICDVCYAIGQSQSRNLNIEYGNITYARTGVDGLNYGALSGAPPQFLRQNLGYLYRVFALSQSVGNCVVENCYAESIVCIGQFGLGAADSASPLTFVGGDFSFGQPGWYQAPLLLETYGPTTSLGTALGFAIELDALNFAMPNVPIQFDHCTFTGTSTANVPSHVVLTLDAANGGYATFVNCWMNGGAFGGNAFTISNDTGRSYGVGRFDTVAGRLAAVYQTYRVSNGSSNGNSEYIYLPYSYGPEIQVNNVTALDFTGSNVTFTCADYLQLLEGDILFWTMLEQGYSLLRFCVPALKIASISGSDVTCDLLFDPSQYDIAANQVSTTVVYVAPNHWAPTVPLTCTTDGTTLASVSPTTILQDGDFVAGANIPPNTRVVSGGGTATVVISQAATSSASDVALYFGRLYAPTLTPAY